MTCAHPDVTGVGKVAIGHVGGPADPAQRDDTVANFRTILREVAESSAVISAVCQVSFISIDFCSTIAV